MPIRQLLIVGLIFNVYWALRDRSKPVRVVACALTS